MQKQNVIIWGAGLFGMEAVSCYKEGLTGINLLAVTDKDSAKWGKYIGNIPIICYKDIGKFKYDKILIFSPKYEDEIFEFIRNECYVPNEKIEIIHDCAYFIYKRVEERYKNVNLDIIDDMKKKEVIRYIAEHDARMFCYDFPDKYLNREIEVFFDETEQMQYVFHEGKRLYFPDKFPNKKMVKQYYNSLCMEQDPKSPHRYQSEKVFVEKNDVILDVGAAEGFFALSVIDKISYAYLVESDKDWERALQATFKPYGNKVKIISKFVSDAEGKDEMTIDGICANKKVDFIKMDIEGAEQKALKGAENTLKEQNVKCSVCVYHNDNDFVKIAAFMTHIHYQCEPSEGYILCGGMWEKDNMQIDFRRGVIRSWRE